MSETDHGFSPLDPVGSIVSVNSVNSISYIVTRGEAPAEFVAGMPIQHVTIGGEDDIIFRASIDFPDMCFLVSAMSTFVREDSDLIRKMGSFRLLLPDENIERLKSRLIDARSSLDKALSSLEGVQGWAPQAEEAEKDS